MGASGICLVLKTPVSCISHLQNCPTWLFIDLHEGNHSDFVADSFESIGPT